MDPRLARHVEQLDSSFRELIAMSPVKIANLPALVPDRGVYLFSEGDLHLSHAEIGG